MMLTRETTAGHDFAHDSKVLGREKMAYIRPAAGGLASKRPIFVLLHPFGGNRTSWARHAPDLMATLAQDFIVVLPECGRGWFINDHAGKRYEDYLIGELIPLVREAYAAGGPACVGGFSMGGASAFFLALKHPDAFAAAFAVAGAFTAGNRTGDPYAAIRSDELLIPTEAEHDRVWGPPGSAVRANYEPATMIGKIEGRTRLPKFYFEVGRDDYPRALEAGETMRALLAGAGAAFEFAQHEGDHSWAYAADGMTRLIAQFREGGAGMAEAARISRRADDLFPPAFRFDDARFGTCVAVRLPAVDCADPGWLLESLHPEERELARSMRGPRLIEWIGGRYASRLARAGMPGAGSPTLSGPNGAPDVGGGVAVSISHSERLAAALARPDHAYAIGVDVEAAPADARGEELLAERILSPAERDGTTIDTAQRLSIKEAAYKAIVGLTGKHLPLREICVERDGDTGFRIRVANAALQVEAISSRIEGHYLSLARARRTV